MKRLIAIAFLLLSGACTYVTSAQPGGLGSTGEGWYVKTTIVFFPVENDIYYCPKETPTRCVKAELKQ